MIDGDQRPRNPGATNGLSFLKRLTGFQLAAEDMTIKGWCMLQRLARS
jgi:hypothetical protein